MGHILLRVVVIQAIIVIPGNTSNKFMKEKIKQFFIKTKWVWLFIVIVLAAYLLVPKYKWYVWDYNDFGNKIYRCNTITGNCTFKWTSRSSF